MKTALFSDEFNQENKAEQLSSSDNPNEQNQNAENEEDESLFKEKQNRDRNNCSDDVLLKPLITQIKSDQSGSVIVTTHHQDKNTPNNLNHIQTSSYCGGEPVFYHSPVSNSNLESNFSNDFPDNNSSPNHYFVLLNSETNSAFSPSPYKYPHKTLPYSNPSLCYDSSNEELATQSDHRPHSILPDYSSSSEVV